MNEICKRILLSFRNRAVFEIKVADKKGQQSKLIVSEAIVLRCI